jgi:hypothetical protein
MIDEWRDIRGYEGHYQVASSGRVRSLKRSKLMAQATSQTGYKQINLYKGGRVKHFYVHRLVAEGFLGPIPPGMEVNHKDGKKHNNDVSNLEIVTALENKRHARELGLVPPPTHLAKLTESQVRKIRWLKGKAKPGEVAKQFGVGVRTIYLIWEGKIWKRVV